MMKNFIKIVCLLLLLATSCKKDFLQRDTGVAITAEDVFKDPVLASRFADNSYNFMIDDYTRLGIPQPYKGATGNFTDEAVHSGADNFINVMNKGNWLDPSATDVGNVYTRMYQGIRNVNIMLANVDAVPWTALQNAKLIKAQMLFLRGFFYYELVKRFGGVILLDKALNQDDELDLKRSSYQQTIDFILKDIQAAEQILATETFTLNGLTYSPATDWNSANTGRPTIGAAKALRCRVLLLDASPLHNSGTAGVVGDINKWKKAADAANEIIAMGRYSLHPDYGKMFNVSSSPEYILLKPRNNRPASGGLIHDGMMSPGSGGAQGLYNPTQNHVDLYEMANGKAINETGSGYNFQTPYVNRDPRFYFNILYNNQDWQKRKLEMWADNSVTPTAYGRDYQPTSSSYTRTRYYVRKLWPEAFIGGTTATALLNFVHFRYGEILLNYAEAVNEAFGPEVIPPGGTMTAAGAINLIRARPTVGMPPLPSGLSQNAMRNRIHNERAVEMAFEEHRWWDLLRWKTAETIIPKPVNAINVLKVGTSFTYNIEPLPDIFQRVFNKSNMYYYPIPRNEINKSKGNLEQNPGW